MAIRFACYIVYGISLLLDARCLRSLALPLVESEELLRSSYG